MKPSYQIVDVKDTRGYAKYLAQNAQLLLPLVELIETSRLAVDELLTCWGLLSSKQFYSYLPPGWPARSTRAAKAAASAGTASKRARFPSRTASKSR